MKKIIVMLACVLAIGAASAQEKKGGLVFECGIGTTRYGNYSAMSVFADPSDSYSLLPTKYVTFGYRHSDGWFVGLTLNNDGGNTSFQTLNERFINSNILLDLRRFFTMTDRIELVTGVEMGLLIHRNTFDYDNDHYSFRRHGMSARYLMGLNYQLTKNQIFGIRVLLPFYGSLTGDKPELPTGLSANDKTRSIGCGFQFGYGIEF